MTGKHGNYKSLVTLNADGIVANSKAITNIAMDVGVKVNEALLILTVIAHLR